MVGETVGVGILLADAPPSPGHQQPVENIGRFVDRGRDCLRCEGSEPVRVDARAGHESPSHVVQVMIYLYAVARALERYQNAKLRGQVTYRDHMVRICGDAVDDQFIQNLGALIRRLSSEEPTRRVQSRQECRFCDITGADCLERIDETSEPEAGRNRRLLKGSPLWPAWGQENTPA